MSGVVVAGGDLKLNPGRGKLGASLDTAFEGGGKGHVYRGIWAKVDALERVGEVGVGGAVAVGVVVVEEIGAFLVRFVGQDDSGLRAVLGLVCWYRHLRLGVHVRLHVGILGWMWSLVSSSRGGTLLCNLSTAVLDDEVLVSMRRRALPGG